MKSIQALTLLFLLASCGGENARYEVKKVEVQPEINTLKVGDAIQLLEGDNSDAAAEIIRRRHTPDFSWSKFWEGLAKDEVLVRLSPDSLGTVLELAEISCQAGDIQSYSHFILRQKNITDEARKMQMLNSLVNVFNVCNKLPSLASNKEAIYEIKELIKNSESQTQRLLSLLETLLSIQKNKLDSQSFISLTESLSSQDWSALNAKIKGQNNTEMLMQFIAIIRLAKTNPEPTVKSLLLDVLKKQTSMAQIIAAFGKTESLKLLSTYGEVVYSDTNGREILKDIEALVSGASEKDATKDWEELNLLKKLLNLNIKKDQVAKAMKLFNSSVKTFEKTLSTDNGQRLKVVSLISDTDILAKWISVRALNSKKNRYVKPAVQMDQYAFEDGIIEDILRARLALYSANPESIDEESKNYCATLASYGINPKKITDINEVRNLLSTKASGCVTFDSGKIAQLELKNDDIVFDDDLHLTLKNSNVSVEAKRFDLNFLDLSSSILHTDVKADASPREVNAIVIPMIMGMKHKFDFESEKMHYFLYYYKMRDASPGVPFYAWNPAKGYAGGSITIKLTASGESVFPLFTSNGGLGQKAQGPRDGGRGVNYSSSFGYSLSDLPEIRSGAKFLRDATKIKEILNANDLETAEVSIIDYIPNVSSEFVGELKDIDRNIEYAKHHLYYQVVGSKKLLEKVAKDALLELKITLLRSPDLEEMPESFSLPDAEVGPMPEPGEKGDKGKMVISI